MNAPMIPVRVSEPLTDHDRYVEWVRACAADGCQVSARELEDLLEEGPEENDLIPIRKLLSDDELLKLSAGLRRFNREHRRANRD